MTECPICTNPAYDEQCSFCDCCVRALGAQSKGLHRRRRASEIGVDLKPNHTTEEGLMESLKFGVIFLVMLACVYLLGGGR